MFLLQKETEEDQGERGPPSIQANEVYDHFEMSAFFAETFRYKEWAVGTATVMYPSCFGA